MSRTDSDHVLVGRIGRPHGVKGEVAVDVESDVPERFAIDAELVLAAPAGRRSVIIETVRRHHGRLLVGFAGVRDRDAARELRGAVLEVPLTQIPPAPTGTYYYFELLDCRCRDRERGELGRVVNVIEDGGGLLLEVADEKRKLLVPFVTRFVVAVDRDEKTIELDLPPGLIDTCASPS